MTTPGTCSIEGCGGAVAARGLCTKHYARQRRNGTTDTVYRRTDVPWCTIPGCDRPTEARGLCLMHYSRARRGSEVADVPAQVTGGTLLERIARKVPEPNEAGCQVWTGQVTGGNELPVIRHGSSSTSVRRALWAQAHPRSRLGGRWVVTSCGTPRCVAVDHLVTTTVHEFNSKDAVTSR